MFRVDKQKIAKVLGISTDGLDELLKRQKGFLLKRTVISSKNILESYRILAEIKDREEKETANKIAFLNKNLYVAKYAKKIEELYIAGYGAVRISKKIYIDHRVSIPKSTIERFIKKSNFKRDV